MLSYVGGEEFNGTQAKAQLVRNSKNTVAYFRDFLGKDFDAIDPTPCHPSAHPMKHDSTVAFSIHDTDSETPNTITVSEITTRHIRRLASSASDFLGKQVNSAVITVPTNFTEQQKHALNEAAKEAGIEVLQFISEPVAAVLAYDARSEAKIEDKIVVVADLGGTRSDIAVIASRGGMYSILATAHDYDFNGAQLDQVLVDHFSKEFLKKHKSDPREHHRSLAKLKLEAEGTKKALSLSANATISVESLNEGIDFASTINRTRYETLSGKIFAGFTRLIEGAIKKADLDVLDIDEVILSGGTSHTPKIASNLQSLFSHSTTILSPSTSSTAINPSDLAARGAAIQASLIQEFDLEDIAQSAHPMVTVTPHLRCAIGVLLVSEDSEKGVFKPVLEAETSAPARRTAIFNCPREGGDVLVKVCEGVRAIKVSKASPKSNANGKNAEDSDDEDDDSEDEEEEVREKVWKVGKVLAEAAIKGIKKGGKVEVMVNVGGDLGVLVTAREVGGKGGVRGTLGHVGVVENGKV
ncbi:Hsp70 protein that interacts with Zuo1p [Xylographa trunciseda]|nr:Hsp70 protein that interacts with Zuo1p [Xylographa trunciseda]